MASVEVMEAPDKSETDHKSYRIIKLSNGLKAALISVPGQKHTTVEPSTDQSESKSPGENSERTAKLAACSLLVDVGSFSNPPDVQGLAHFLEHMVLLGSEKYPAENEFEQFMQKSGGFVNANTEYNETCFYFKTNEQFLDEALDRFSQFFKAPLMLKESMTREREAIESEFSAKKINEIFRRNHLLASIGQPGHPIRSFACGNLKTLKDNIDDDVLYQKVHEFRKRHYSAHRMYVCVQSQSTLDELQEMVTRHFSTVPTNDLPGDDFSAFTHQNAFQSKFYEKVYFVKPISNICRVDITWCMEPMIQKFKCKPDYYLGHVLGNEGHGSLLSYLRKQLWADELVAGSDTYASTSLYTLFKINVSLTELGFNHLDDVLEAIFSYLKLMQLSGPKETIFREIETIRSNAFKFHSEISAYDNVQNVVSYLKNYPNKYILSGERKIFEYNPDEIQKMVDELSQRKFNIMVTSTHRYNENVTYESTEQWCGTMYTELDVPAKWIELWENAKAFDEFTLPEPNPFLADDFTLAFNGDKILPKYPTKIHDNDLCELWFRHDDTFLLPVASFNFYLISSSASTNNDTLILLLLKLLQHQLVERFYPAKVAGIHYEFSVSEMGIIFQVYGFNQKLHLVVEEFSKALKSLADTSTEEQFNMFTQQLSKSCENILIQPKLLSLHLCFNATQFQRQPLFERHERLRTIKYDDFIEFCRHFCDEMRINALIQGNVTESHAQDVVNCMVNELTFRKIENLSSVQVKINKLPIGANYLRCRNFSPTDINTAVTNLYQIGPISHRKKVLVAMLIMIGQEPLFNTLRTVEQLAYDVSFSIHKTYGILGYNINVNSRQTKFSAEHVDERIENFRQSLQTIIENISDENFNVIKTSLVKNMLSKDNKLTEEAVRNWNEIINGEYEFDRRVKEVECLSMITKNDLLEFCRLHHGENERKLSVQIIGNGNANVPNESGRSADSDSQPQHFDSLQHVEFNGALKGNLITDFMAFKNNLDIFPTTKNE